MIVSLGRKQATQCNETKLNYSLMTIGDYSKRRNAASISWSVANWRRFACASPSRTAGRCAGSMASGATSSPARLNMACAISSWPGEAAGAPLQAPFPGAWSWPIICDAPARMEAQRYNSIVSRGPLYFAWGCFRDFLFRPCRAPPKGRRAAFGTPPRAEMGPGSRRAIARQGRDDGIPTASSAAPLALRPLHPPSPRPAPRPRASAKSPSPAPDD
jgi:hypothetical protein